MTPFFATLGFLGIALLGTTNPPPVQRVYKVAISSEFELGSVISIVDAIKSWNDALPGELLLRPAIEACDHASPAAQLGRLICIHPVTQADLIAVVGSIGVIGVTFQPDFPVGPWQIMIATDYLATGAPQQMVTAHELGHAMGLLHNPHRHTLMVPYMTACDSGQCRVVQALTPTPADVAAWRHARDNS